MAGTHTFTIEQGADWSRVVRWQLADDSYVDFTGYTVRMQLRDGDGELIEELTDGTGEVTISGTSLMLSLTDTRTADIVGDSYAYDLFVTSPGGVDTRLFAGFVDVVERVTQ